MNVAVCSNSAGNSRGGHSHMRNTYGCDQGHSEVTRPRRFFLVGHRVTKVFQAAQNSHGVIDKAAFHVLRVEGRGLGRLPYM